MDKPNNPIKYERSRELRDRAHNLIPAGCHTYSKGEDQFPYEAPGFIDHAEGCIAYDVDGNRFLDWGMGLRTVILGHCYQPVIDSVQNQLQKGSNFTLPAPLEADLAELMVDLIPSAEMVKFAKNGSDTTSAAIRLARAYTGKDYIAICGDGSFFSVNDWFVGSTPVANGVPENVQNLTLKFSYNNLSEVESLFDRYADNIAAVILEPATYFTPVDGYLEGLRRLTTKHGSLLIFDEMITGFRWHLQGAQKYYEVIPDLSTFGKAIANGFSMSALVGRRDIMELGGLDHDREKVFLLSLTHGGETHSLAAAITTINEMRDRDVVNHIWGVGAELTKGFNNISAEMGLANLVSMEGYPCSPLIVCRDQDGSVSPGLRTLFLQEMIANGVLIPYVVPSFAHKEIDIEFTLDAVRRSLVVYGRAIDGGLDNYLHGKPVKPVFRKFN